MLTTVYYVVTTSLLHVYHLVLHVYHFFTTCLLLFIVFYYIFLFCYTSLLLLTAFEYVVPRFTIFVYFFGQTPPLILVPSSHYYLGSLIWTSRTFYFPDSRYLLEVLGDFLGRERGGSP